MARAPKVFTWSDGLHLYTVATSSKVKALAAWGVTRDLFKDGEAKEVSEGPDLEAALARPGEVIRSDLAVSLPNASAKFPRRRSAPPGAPPKPSRAQVARTHALEREIASLDRQIEALEAEVAARRARLDREAEERRAQITGRRVDAERELSEIREIPRD